MKLSDVRDLLIKGGLKKCQCWKIPKKDASLPWAVVTKPSNGTRLYADNGTYYGSMKVVLFVALYPDDEETEEMVDNILSDEGINFTYEMTFVQEDEICLKIYTFEVKEC